MLKSAWAGRLLRRRAASTTLLGVATAAVVVMAVTATGVPVNHVSANNGGVWLTNNSATQGFPGAFGEFNVPIKQIDYAFGDPGRVQPSYDLDVLQQGTTIIAYDRGLGELYPVDETTGLPNTSAGVVVPAGSQVALDAGVVAVLAPARDGQPARLWATEVGTGQEPALGGVSANGVKPVARLAGSAAVAVDTAGDVWAASRSEMVELPAQGSGFGPLRTTKFPTLLSSVAMAAVGTVPVVLDPAEKVVHFPLTGGATTLPTSGGQAAQTVIQQSSPADPSVLVADSTTLYSVPLAGGPPVSVYTGGRGQPAAPVRLAGCAYAAWGGGNPVEAEACPGAAAVAHPVPIGSGADSTIAAPVLRVNNDEIVLNDVSDGAAWLVAGAPLEVLHPQDWLRVLTGNQNKQSDQPHRGTINQQQYQKKQPKLPDVTLNARAGRDSVLHVLDGATDPSGSILSITQVTPASGPGFSVRLSPDTQTLVIRLVPDATGPVSFQYSVVDGVGETASANVHVDVVSPQQEPAPIQVQPDPAQRPVVSGGTVSLQVLGSWRDPDSGPLSVADASVAGGAGQVSWTSDGLVTFEAPTEDADTPVSITYHVTDGSPQAGTGTLKLLVLGRNDARAYPPTAVPDAVQVLRGRPTTFAPLANDIFGADPTQPGARLQLAGPVAAQPGVTVSTNSNTGQITIDATNSGAYWLKYQATWGSATSSQQEILVQAVSPAGTVQPPVTTPASVLLHGQYPQTVDVLANDYDPAGGLLTVVGVSAPADLQATVEQGEYLRITAQASNLAAQSELVTYQVTNGLTDPVTGQVTVMMAPAGATQPPVVPDTYATVKAGYETDIPVMASATDPDGEAIYLVPGSAPGSKLSPVSLAPTVPGAATPALGTVSVSGGYLRYEAPAAAGITAPESVTVSYSVESQSGQQTTGQAFVTVIPDTRDSVTPPEPSEVDARVTAGGTVTIPIPTSGVAPDGDMVSVTGFASTPQLGRVLSFTGDSITYQAFPTTASGAFAGGTDSFEYQVEGPTGLSAEALVRVGISQPGQPQAPVAVDHFVTAAPGQAVQVDLLAGDIIGPQDHVTVVPLPSVNATVPAGAALAGPGGQYLQVPAPSGATTTSVAYGITDGLAKPSVAHVFVRSQAGFVNPPVAIDHFPSAPAAGAATVTVDALAGDSDPGGTASDLVVVGSPVAGVTVQGPNLVIPVSADPRAVPYAIRSTATSDEAVGVIYVPGTAPGPRLVAGRTIKVPAGASTTISIGDYVTEPGHHLYLVSNSNVGAAPSGGLAAQAVSTTSVKLTGLGHYVGPASLDIAVIDNASLSAAGARQATFSIPVQVGSPTPVVHCPTNPITVVQSGPAVDVTVASVCSVWTPDGSSPASLAYTTAWARQARDVALGWAPGQTGRTLSLRAGSTADGGETGTITVGVAGAGPSADSALQVQVVGAPAPTLGPVTAAPTAAGSTVTVDLRQYAQSPLANPDISVVSVTQATGMPAQATASGPIVTLRPASATHGLDTFTVKVSDEQGAPVARQVTGTLSLQVLDKPGAPTGVQAEPGSGQVTITWGAAPDNGAPVEYYTVAGPGLAPKQVSGTSLTYGGLSDNQAYTFTVTATNQVGTGPAATSPSAHPHAVPGAPTGVTATGADRSATVRWQAADANGMPIQSYIVSVAPVPPGGAATRTVPGSQLQIDWTGLDNAIGPYTFTVVADNSDGQGPRSTSSNRVYSFATPPAPPTPTATGAVSTDQTDTQVTVQWAAIANCNDAQPCAGYTVTEYKNGTVLTTNSQGSSCGGGNMCASFGPLTNDGGSYTYTLEATNVEKQTSAPSPASAPAVKADGIPAPVTDLTAAPGDTVATVSFTLPDAHGSGISKVNYTVTGGSAPITGSWTSPGNPGDPVHETISGLVNGTTYSFNVSACNETGTECGGPSNTATADPYGKPNPPSVSATPSGYSVTYAWSGGGNNGRPVASYGVCIQGSCRQYSAAGQTSVTYPCNNGSTQYSIYAYVVDTVGQTSADSPTSSTLTQHCNPPNPPALSAAQSGNSIVYSWSGGGGQGLAIDHYELCPSNGGCMNEGPNPGSYSDNYGCGQSGSATAYVVDSSGQQSGSVSANSSTAACPAPPPPSPSISVSWGPNPAPYGNWMSVTWSNFSTGSHSFYCVEGGTNYGPYTVNITSSPYTATTGTCYDATPGNTDYVTTDGVKSNVIASD